MSGNAGGTHGLRSTYIHYRCRCDDCTEANRVDHKRGNETRAERLAANPSLRPHGNAQTYNNWGCRCDDCKAAKALENAKRSRKQFGT